MEEKLRTSKLREKTRLDFIDRLMAFILFLTIVLVNRSRLLCLWPGHKTKERPQA